MLRNSHVIGAVMLGWATLCAPLRAQGLEVQLASGQVELARLVDVASLRLGVRLTYDEASLKSKVMLRLPNGLSDCELWELVNRLLAEQGLVTARLGGPDDPALAVVKAAVAAQLARAEEFEGSVELNAAGSTVSAAPVPEGDLAPLSASPAVRDEQFPPSFRKLTLRLRHISTKEAAGAIGPLLSKPAGSVVEEPATRTLIVADLRRHADAAARAALAIDVPSQEVRVVEHRCVHLGAAALAAAATQVAARRDAVAGIGTPSGSVTTSGPGGGSTTGRAGGELIAAPDGRTVLVVAPADRLEAWLELVSRLDQRERVESKRYSAGALGAEEAARLVQQTVAAGRASHPGGSLADDRWSALADEATGTLLLTGTPSQHELAEQTLARLESAPAQARRPLKSFVLRHRSVRDVLAIVERLVSIGMLDAESEQADGGQEVAAGGPGRGGPIATAEGGTARRDGSAVPPPAPDRSGISLFPEPSVSPLLEGMSRGSLRVGGSRTRGRAGRFDALTLTADEATNTLIAVGNPRVLVQLEKLLPTLDVRQPQVMIEAVLVSLSDSQSMQLGVELEKINLSGGTLIRLASLFGLSSAGTGANAGSRTAGDSAGFTGVVLNPGDFSVIIRALETVNQGRSLSVPRVLVNNNQQATFNSTLQQPYASTNASDTVATTSLGGTFDAGTTISVRPQIAEADHLVLDYQVKLSSFTGSASRDLPPPRQENSVTSVATIPDGYTVVVGGLEAVTDGDGESRVPGLGAIPVIGELFKNRTNQRSRARFFVFLRANVMRGAAGTGFEELKHISDRAAGHAALSAEQRAGGWPELEPRIIR